MNSRTLLIVLLAGIFAPVSALPSETSEQILARNFEAYFKKQVSEAKIPGAAYVITRPQGPVQIGTHGHTDTSKKKPIDADTTFRVASVSKTFAAGLAAVLINEGRFDWEDRVVHHVPDFRIKGDTKML